MPLTTLKRRSLFREIQSQIREYIIDHDLSPGDKLPPAAQLATSLGVSSGSLREAIRALTALGVLETRHGVGTFVRAYDLSPILENLSFSLVFERDSLRELLQLREAMEAGLLAEATNCMDDAILSDLQSAVDEMGEPGKARDSDYRFHQLLYQCLENRLVSELIEIFARVVHDLNERHVIAPPLGVDPQEEHRRILEAVKAGDAHGAIAALRQHFRIIKMRLVIGPAHSASDP